MNKTPETPDSQRNAQYYLNEVNRLRNEAYKTVKELNNNRLPHNADFLVFDILLKQITDPDIYNVALSRFNIWGDDLPLLQNAQIKTIGEPEQKENYYQKVDYVLLVDSDEEPYALTIYSDSFPHLSNSENLSDKEFDIWCERSIQIQDLAIESVVTKLLDFTRSTGMRVVGNIPEKLLSNAS